MTAKLLHENGCATLRLEQEAPPTPGQSEKQPMPIPLRVALFDRKTTSHCGEQLIVLDKAAMEVPFPGFAARPVLSINRGFSAPVAIESDLSGADYPFPPPPDHDPLAPHQAMQTLVVQHIVSCVSGGHLCEADREAGRKAVGEAFAKGIADPALDGLMRGELLLLPAESYLAEQFLVADPGAIHAEREALKAWLGRELRDALEALHDRACAVPYSRDAAARGARKLKTQALVYLAAADPARTAGRAFAQYRAADCMTDRQGALMVLCSLDAPERAEALTDFHQRHAGNALVIDKWFTLQAGSLHRDVLDHVQALGRHPEFTLSNPNRVRALYMAMAVNPKAFHAASGEGYRTIADLILALDPINAQTAARFVPPLGRWRRIEPARSALMKAELERILAAPGLSRDTFEQVSKSLG